MKREMFRKLMAASLATVMVAGLAGCGNDDNASSGASGSNQPSGGNNVVDNSSEASGSGDDVSPYPILTDANGNKYDLGGAKVYLYSWFGEDILDTPYGRAVNEYREWAQNEYNFTYEWKGGAGGWGDFQHLGEIAQGTFYENKELCMVMLPNNAFSTVMSAAEQNLLWDLNSLGVFDFSEARWKQNGVSDLFQTKGGVYACAVQPPEPRGGVFFNATLLQDLTGITPDEMYDLQAKGEWTWEKFMQICEQIYQKGDVDGDGVQDYYSVCGNGRSFTGYALASNNTSYIRMKDDGKFEYTADAPATLEALEFSREVRRNPYWYTNPDTSESAAWDFFYEAFDIQGKYVFLVDEAYQMTGGANYRLSATDDANNAGEYGFLMFPIGTSSGGKYINGLNDNIIVLPKCYTEDEAKTIAAAFEIIYADVIPGFIGYNSRIDGFEANVYHERALEETLTRMMSENPFIDSGKLMPDLDTSAVMDDTSKSVSEALAAVETEWKTKIDEYNNK